MDRVLIGPQNAWMNPRADQVFDEWARAGRDRSMGNSHFPRGVQVLQRMGLARGARALDLGCGNGWATAWMRSQTGPSSLTVGVDFARTMIERARVEHPDTPFLRADFTALPFVDRGFDALFSMEALYYAIDLDGALGECRRVLRPGATLAICIDYYRENPHCASWPADLGVPMQLLSETEWARQLERVGFGAVQTFRCLDPRPVDARLPPAERRATADFRQRVGSLGLMARR